MYRSQLLSTSRNGHESTGSRCNIAVLVWASTPPEYWIECLRASRNLEGAGRIVVAMPNESELLHDVFPGGTVTTTSGSSLPSELTSLENETDFDAVLLVHAPVVFPPTALERSASWIRNDPRIGTVSFFSNSAGYLSLPNINGEIPIPRPEGHNERTLTSLLRTGPDSGPVPIAVPEGGAVLIGRSALTAAGPLSTSFSNDPKILIAEFGLRTAGRGIGNYLDAGTFVYQPWSPPYHGTSTLQAPEAREHLHARYWYFPEILDHQATSREAPLRAALDLAIAKVSGVRVLIDASCIGPLEMGTQTALVSLVGSLADDDRVSWIGVGLPTKQIPRYALNAFSKSKVEIVESDGLQFPAVSSVDILHRPFQPDASIPWARWRAISKRIVVSVLDLIAYRSGGYFDRWESWLSYRNAMRTAAAAADAILTISNDVANVIQEERLPISADRLFPIALGADHIAAQVEAHPPRFPRALEGSGLAASDFLLVLGATYSHKNRDLSVRVWRELNRRGLDLSLVMAGAMVPYGSTRVEEALASVGDRDPLIIPDVSCEERNWLMSHASLVMYLTSAEGFGLVPFEAAHFGKPTLHVSFGPLKELLADDCAPSAWSITALADRAEDLLNDAQARDRAVNHVRAAGENLSWMRTAAKTVDAYESALSLPPRISTPF